MTIRPPVPEIQFDLENSRSKVKFKGFTVSPASIWLVSLVFHIRVSYGLPSFCSMTIGPPIPEIQFYLENSRARVNVKGQGQRYPSQRSIQLTRFLIVLHKLDQPLLRMVGPNRMLTEKTDLKFYKKIAKKGYTCQVLQRLDARCSLYRGDGENVPGIPGACATRNFAYMVRGPGTEIFKMYIPSQHSDNKHSLVIQTHR